MKEAIDESYGRKGQEVLEMNYKAVDRGIDALVKVDVPSSWKDAVDEAAAEIEVPDFIKDVVIPMNKQEGDSLPVSAFCWKKMVTSQWAPLLMKRGIAVSVPEWQMNKCIQCNQCSYVCPHAAIRPILLTEEEKNNAPEGFQTRKL